MKAISAHVTGFYRSSFHAYTTEVNVDGHRWRLGLRYSKFHDFYDQLVLLETDSHFTFPPKGSLFFTPKPEERQEQLEDFLQQVLAYYAAKNYPVEMEELLCELLKVPRHLKSPEREDDDVSTSTESVLDEPVHEPLTDSLAVEKQPQLEEKVHAVEVQKAAEVVQEAEEVSVKEEEQQKAPVAEKQEVAAPEPVQQPGPIAEEPRPVEEVEPPVVHEDADTQEAPATAGGEEVTKDVEEDLEQDVAAEAEAVTAQVHEEEPATKSTAVEDEANEEAPVEICPQDPVEVSPEAQDPVVEPIACKEELVTAEPQRAYEPAAVVPLEKEAHKELASSGRVSSWIAACLPKSLLGFIRRRCLKKTNLVVLCVALLLPMVLARR